MKSEALPDIGEVKNLYLDKEIKENDKLEVFLEKEDALENVIVSATKAKIKGFNELKKKFESGENIKGKFIQKIKGGVIIEDVITKVFAFAHNTGRYRPLKSLTT